MAPGGALPLEGGMGMCRGHDPLFFRASRRSLASQFTINAPFMCPHFQFLENFAFSALFWAKISALKTQNFWIFAPKTPQFSRKTRSLDPTFGNPCGTYPPKKKLSAPPPGLWLLQVGRSCKGMLRVLCRYCMAWQFLFGYLQCTFSSAPNLHGCLRHV